MEPRSVILIARKGGLALNLVWQVSEKAAGDVPVFSHPRVGTGNTRSVVGERPPGAITVDQSPQVHGVQSQDDVGLTLSDPLAEIHRRNGTV